MPRALIVEIFGNAKQFGEELDRAAGKTRQMGKVAGVAGLALAGGLAYGLEKSVKAAAAMQTTTAKMDNAFKSAGVSTDKWAGQINTAESSGRKLGFTNIDIRESLGNLATATQNGGKALKDMAVAEDLARFKHISLADSTKILSSAMAGSTRAARQLGIAVTASHDASTQASIDYANQKKAIDALFPSTSKMTEAQTQQKTAMEDALKVKFAHIKADAALTDKQKTSASVIDMVTQRVHNQAQAYSQTAAGGMAQFHAQMEALQENLGSALLPSLTVLSQKLADVTGWLSKHTEVAKIAVVVLGGLAATLMAVGAAQKIYAAYQTLSTAATKLFTIAQEEEDAALVANPIGIVVVALAALGAALYLAWTKSQTFRNIVEGAWHGIQAAAQAVVNFFTSTVPNAFDTVRRTAVTAANAIKGVWDGVRGAWAAAWNGIVNAIIGPIKTAIGWIHDLISLIHSIPSIHIPNIGHAGSNTPTLHNPGPLTGHALGGVFNVPTLAMIGERGPEAVVPLNRAGLGTGVGGGSPTINVTVHGWVGSDQQIAQRLRNELVSLGRREPNIFAGYA